MTLLMKIIHRKTFFDAYRAAWGSLKQPQVIGLENLLRLLEEDAR